MVASAVVGAALIGGAVASKSASKQAKATKQAALTGVEEQRESRAAFEARTQPFADIGLSAGEQLQEFLAGSQEPGQANQRFQSFLDNPTQQLSEINPIVDFLREQGFERIEESAAAGGRLGAGGTLRDLSKFNTQLVSTVVPQLQQQRFGQLLSSAQFENQLKNERFNQLFNVTGIGANAATGQGNAALQTGTNISNLFGAAGQARAQGIAGRSSAITGGLQNLTAAAGAFPDLFSSTPPPTFNQAPTGPPR